MPHEYNLNGTKSKAFEKEMLEDWKALKKEHPLFINIVEPPNWFKTTWELGYLSGVSDTIGV